LNRLIVTIVANKKINNDKDGIRTHACNAQLLSRQSP
jgi:hypothetical protein